MDRFTSRLLIALLTFTLVLLLAISCRQSHQRPEVIKVATPTGPPSNTFEGTGNIDMFMEDYRRASDGAIVRFGCSDRASATGALASVRNGREARCMEKTNVVNVQGAKVGERIVCDANDSSEAKVMWNEGSRQFHINAPSLEDALTFEKSKVWMSAGCLDFQSFQPCHPTKPCI